MTLTPEGSALIQYKKITASAEGDLIAKITGDDRQEVTLTLVGPTSAISTRIAKECASIYAKHPFLRLHLQSEDHEDLVSMVKCGESDLAVVPLTQVPNEMQSKLLRPDRYFLVASSKWKNRELKEILKTERIIDFYDSDSTSLNYLKKFGLESFVKRSRLFVNENEALIHYFASGVGFGTLTETIARPFLNDGSLIQLNRGQVMEAPLALIWYSRSKQLKYFEEVIRSIK